ncbi:MAG: S8 family serine peptidase [Lysobacteraceae bacterium]
MMPNAPLRRLPLAVALALVCHAAHGAELHPDLVATAQRDGRVEALIVLEDQTVPLLAPMSPGADYKARRRALVDALRSRADARQADVRAWLDARGIAWRAFWIANTIHASLSADELAQLSLRTDIAALEPNMEMSLQRPEPEPELDRAMPASDAVAGIEWGVSMINAPQAWAEGVTGQGVVIAGQDTGYEWAHPAIKPQYRGWNAATQSADHNYHWHDAIHSANGSCPANGTQPCDDDSHGTHTAGTFAGDDGGSNQIGVAPGARWIGCRNMNDGNGTPATYLECMEWFLAPTDLAGQNPDPNLAPDVISNSWGCPPSEGCTPPAILEQAVSNLVAGGIFFAAAAGNDGPSCSSIFDPPAIYDASFVVGSSTSADAISSFSGRGPVSGTSLIRPDIVAPGSGVRSAVPGGGYGSKNGTSMATPHVAGAAALVMSANPSLKGQPHLVGELLRATATRTGITDPSRPNGCGGLTINVWPNHQAGFGRLDAYAAVVAARDPALTPVVFADGFEED